MTGTVLPAASEVITVPLAEALARQRSLSPPVLTTVPVPEVVGGGVAIVRYAIDTQPGWPLQVTGTQLPAAGPVTGMRVPGTSRAITLAAVLGAERQFRLSPPVLLTVPVEGIGVGVTVGEGVTVGGVAVGVGLGVGLGVGEGEGVAVGSSGVGLGVAVAMGVGLGVGEGFGSTPHLGPAGMWWIAIGLEVAGSPVMVGGTSPKFDPTVTEM